MLNPRKFEVDTLIQNLNAGIIVVNYDEVKNLENKQILTNLSKSIENYIFNMELMIIPNNVSIDRVYAGFTNTFLLGILRYRDQEQINPNITATNRESDNHNRLMLPHISQTQINLQNINLDLKQIFNKFEEVKNDIEKDSDIDIEDKTRLLDSLKEIKSLRDTSLSDNKKDQISTFHKTVKRIGECSDHIFSKPYAVQMLSLIANALLKVITAN